MTQPEGFGETKALMQLRKQAATAQGGQAFARLLALAETRDSGQARRIAQFIAVSYDGAAFPFDLFELRAVDEAIGDDMLALSGRTALGSVRSVSAGAKRRTARARRDRQLGPAPSHR